MRAPGRGRYGRGAGELHGTPEEMRGCRARATFARRARATIIAGRNRVRARHERTLRRIFRARQARPV